MTDHARLVRQFHARVAGLLARTYAVAAITGWLFVWGTAVLLLRAGFGVSADDLAWGAAGVAVAAGGGAWLARRRQPDLTAVRAFLDSRAGCGGFLMAEVECGLGNWTAPVPSLPPLRWHVGRPLGLLALSAVYLALAFLLPAGTTSLAGGALDVRGEADRLGDQVRVLKEEKVIEPERAEALKQRLDDVRTHAAGKEPAKTLEALDHLHDVVRQEARQAAEAAARQATKLDQLSTAADALQKAAPKLDDKAAAALMAELAALAQKAAAEAERFKEELAPELAAALEKGALSKGQLAELGAAAQAGKAALGKSAQKLYDARLIDADQLKACKGDGAGDGKAGSPGGSGADTQGLADYLAKNGGKASLAEGLAEGAGRGGVNEGPGAAALQFGDRTSEEGAKFREEALPPAARAALKDSQGVGVSKTVPKADPAAGAPGAGALAGAAAGGGSANAAPVLPQHKAAVGRYFDRPGN